MANSLDLTTLADVKAWLGLPTPVAGQTPYTDDALLTRMTTAASAFIQSTLNRTFGVALYVETRNGKNTDTMLVADYPIIYVQSVIIGNKSIPRQAVWTQNGPAPTGFSFSDKAIYLNGGYRFCKGRQNVTFVYQAGYDPIPFEISQVCIELVGKKYEERKRIGLRSAILEGQNIFYDLKDINDEMKSVLGQYKKVVPIGL